MSVDLSAALSLFFFAEAIYLAGIISDGLFGGSGVGVSCIQSVPLAFFMFFYAGGGGSKAQVVRSWQARNMDNAGVRR